jgi:hypothetical protein
MCDVNAAVSKESAGAPEEIELPPELTAEVSSMLWLYDYDRGGLNERAHEIIKVVLASYVRFPNLFRLKS